MWRMNSENVCQVFDWLLPQEIVKQEIKNDHSKRRALLQARAVVTVTVSAFFALVTQLFLDMYSAFGFREQNSEMIREITVLLSLWGTLIYSAILYAIRYETLSITHAAKLGIYSFIMISAYAAIFGNGKSGFHTLSHANFFAVPPFGCIFVSKNFGKQTLLIVCVVYVVAFCRSIGREDNPLSFSSTGWVVCDVYILCFVYFLFAAYEQEFSVNQDNMQRSLDEVVNQVLTFAKIEHGKIELENNVFDIFTLIQEIGDGLAPIPERKRLDLVIFFKVNPSHRFMIGDVGCMRQIILNLLGNAIKFTDRGRIKLNVIELNLDDEESAKQPKKVAKNAEVSSGDGEPASKNVMIRIEVIDTGRGIAPDFLAHMYQPFSQEDSSLRRKFEGTGLGLSIVKGLLDMMHSQLEVKSDTKNGSNFSFCLTLPISPTFEDMHVSPLPFSHEHLKLPAHKQEELIAQLRSLSFVILNRSSFLSLQRISEYFTEWGFNYRIVEKENMKSECSKENCDIILLNDSITDLQWFLSEFKTQQPDIPAISTATTNTVARTKPVSRKGQSTKTAIRPDQCVVFFSTIAEYDKAEKILKEFKPRSAVVVSKPGGPVKFLNATIKAMESIRSQKTVETTCSSPSASSSSSLSGKANTDSDNVILLHTAGESQQFTSEMLDEDELLFSPSIFGSAATNPSSQEIHELQKHIEEQLLSSPPIEVEDSMRQDKFSFLVVEDNKINAMILTTMLKQAHYRNYDDLQMPICDGIEATKEIRKLERGEPSHLLPSTHTTIEYKTAAEECHNSLATTRKRRKKAIIVAMTGLASQEDSNVAEQAGCNEFLTKPVSIKTLHSRMEEWTREALKRQHEEAAQAAQEPALLEEHHEEKIEE
ncbi:7948_t:CDS:10, partial [Ambispora gerdemannii]